MAGSRTTCVVLLATVLGWTTHPLFCSASATVEATACPWELDKESDLEKLELTGLDGPGPLPGTGERCLARIGDWEPSPVEVLVCRLHHLRGPPTT